LAKTMEDRRVAYESLVTSLTDVDVFTKHVAQVTDELKKVQAQRHVERIAAASEQQALEAKWLRRLQCSKLEAALHADGAARDQCSAGKALKSWAEAIGVMRRESLQHRRDREVSLQLHLRDSGRGELLRERLALQDQATKSALAGQKLRAALSERSAELDRTVRRETMSLQQQAADAARTAQVLMDVQSQHEATEAQLRAELAATTAALEREGADGRDRAAQSEQTVALILTSDVRALELRLRITAASQAVIVRLAAQQVTLHRYWKAWAVVASLLLREAGGALLQIELSKQQQRGVHMRLQQELAAELAQARVENLEARSLLAKADIIDQLAPGHELVTDKETVQEQRRALQAAHSSAAAAHLTAAAHRVGEATLSTELKHAEELEPGSSSQRGSKLHEQAVLRELEERLRCERSALDFLQAEHTGTMADLRRANCEARVLVRSLQHVEAEASTAPRLPPQRGDAKPPRPPSPGRGPAAGGKPTPSKPPPPRRVTRA